MVLLADSYGPNQTAGWSGTSLSTYAWRHVLTWHGPQIRLLTLSMLGKKVKTSKYFSHFFLEKKLLDISCISLGDNFHEMSNPTFWEKIRKVWICRLLNSTILCQAFISVAYTVGLICMNVKTMHRACMNDNLRRNKSNNKRLMGHDSLTWVKQPLHICSCHAIFFQYCHSNST